MQMDIECMEILDDDDDPKEVEDNPDGVIYECDFDISKMVSDTLSGLDVNLQIRDAITAARNTIDVLATKQKTSCDVFVGLEMQIKKLEVFTTTKLISSLPAKNSAESNTLSMAKARAHHQNDNSMDVIPLVKIVNRPSQLPPSGELVRKQLIVGNRVFAMKGNVFSVWYRGKILERKDSPSGEKLYKVKYESKKSINPCLSGKHLAYPEPSDVSLPVGTRVIAQYRDEYFSQVNSMYAGVIAEPLKIMNKYRLEQLVCPIVQIWYLVFFDDGYAQYVEHKDVRVVCDASREVWEDVHSDSKDFIKKYLKQYPERPMVKLQKNHIVKTEWNGKWWVAKVMEVDGSLVKMYFTADRRTEWIYRGSTRLGPLYSELANAEAVRQAGRGARRHNLALVKKSAPYVEYTRAFDEPSSLLEDVEYDEQKQEQVARKHSAPSSPRQVARKSTTVTTTPVKRPSIASKSVESEGSFEPLTCEFMDGRNQYKEHAYCSVICLGGKDDDPLLYKGRNPLYIPTLCGWERQIAKYKSISKLSVFYRAPCGRRLRTLDEIYDYLVITNSKLTVDLFCMDNYVHCDGEFKPAQILCYIKDISYGKENVPVSGVNSFDRNYPDYVEYSTKRIPNKGVSLNLDPEFLVCCDCDDNCMDRSKCECQRLTIEATGATHDGHLDENAGYYYRRLREPLLSGLYECNSRCKCYTQCLNRVVQNGLNLRLQVFKTEKRGWGIRCLDDIPKGGFICTYAGQLLTEQGANEDGTQFGDEYLAELDYIEVVERQKEGYESDVVDADDDDDADNNDKSKNSRSAGSKNDQQHRRKEDSKRREKSSDDPNYSASEDKDSDYEARSCSPVAPRTPSARSVRHGHSADDQLNGESSSEVGSSVATETDTTDKTEAHAEDSTTPSSSQNIPIEPIVIDSDSEDDSSKTSKTSSDRKGSTPKDYLSSRSLSRLWTMPDPCKKEGSIKHITGLTSEPGKRIKYQSARGFFGDKFCYIMDAKSLGNIGRYLNHSCNPNAFVQNVFVDTHDLRFPWVTFFALQYIRAGSELTWDYNYEVGSVPNKVMYCYCGAKECRGRLL